MPRDAKLTLALYKPYFSSLHSNSNLPSVVHRIWNDKTFKLYIKQPMENQRRPTPNPLSKRVSLMRSYQNRHFQVCVIENSMNQLFVEELQKN